MTEKQNNSRVKDSSGKLIFGDPKLCSQFLKGYVDIPLLKNVQPEDIEDVTNRYVHMFAEERNSDVVKKIRIKEEKGKEELPFYIISLIEHKSNVDYNVVMQMLRYMVFIWEDYEREMERKHEGVSKTKSFQYPPILSIIFYDGIENWTAVTQLKDRIFLSNVLTEYIPDFNCILVQLQNFSNTELMKRKDELSIIMLIDKLRNVEEFTQLSDAVDDEYLKNAVTDSPKYLLDIMSQIIEVFLSKLNIPYEEAADYAGQVKEKRMGELFQHFQGYDVQATRREEREKTTIEVTERVTREVTEKVTKELTNILIEENIKKLINSVKKLTNSQEKAVEQVVEQYGLKEQEAKEKVCQYWK